MDEKEKEENRKNTYVQVSIKQVYFQKIFSTNTSSSIFQNQYCKLEEYSSYYHCQKIKSMKQIFMRRY